METARLKIEGMTGIGCANGVTRALVTYDPALALTRAGYKAE